MSVSAKAYLCMNFRYVHLTSVQRLYKTDDGINLKYILINKKREHIAPVFYLLKTNQPSGMSFTTPVIPVIIISIAMVPISNADKRPTIST